jgi:hypothetical protein
MQLMAWHGIAGGARLVRVGIGSTRQAWHDAARPGQAGRGRRGEAWPGPARLGAAGTAGEAWRGAAWRGEAWQARRGAARSGVTRRGLAGMAGCGQSGHDEARLGQVPPGMAWQAWLGCAGSSGAVNNDCATFFYLQP